MKPPFPAQFPAHVPIVDMSSEDIGTGWRRVNIGETVKTYHQAFVLWPQAGWRISAYFTADGFKNPGKTNYRSPASLGAWVEVAPQVARKVWRKWFASPRKRA